jgi:site-specific DNA-methyltransferase (adenine-specific)
MPNIFLNADCMDPEVGLPSYPDNHFDLAIVDPPYGIGEDGTRALSRKGNSEKWKNQKVKVYGGKVGWDDVSPDEDYFKHLFRVSKNQIIWGANYYPQYLTKSMGWVCWYKKGQNPNSDFSDCELAYTSFWRALKWAKFDWTGFGAVNAGEHRIHPTQKPKALYCWLLENYAQPNDLILDTHVGSASSLIACESMGFNYVGYELDPDYYAAAQNRMSKGIQLQML